MIHEAVARLRKMSNEDGAGSILEGSGSSLHFVVVTGVPWAELVTSETSHSCFCSADPVARADHFDSR